MLLYGKKIFPFILCHSRISTNTNTPFRFRQHFGVGRRQGNVAQGGTRIWVSLPRRNRRNETKEEPKLSRRAELGTNRVPLITRDKIKRFPPFFIV